jgi:hypothetical protein
MNCHRKSNESNRSPHHTERIFPPVIALLLCAGLFYLLGDAGVAQIVQVGGQASTAFIKSGDSLSQNNYNGGRATLAWRLDLFTDVLLSEEITFRGTVRILQDGIVHVDRFSIEAGDLTPLHLTLEAGELDLPVGRLGEHRYPMRNPFLQLPLMNEHITTLRSSDYQLWPFDTKYSGAGNGVRLLDQGLYDIGARLSGSFGILDLSAAVFNGTPGRTTAYYGSGLNSTGELGAAGQVGLTPVTGLTVSGSYAHGLLAHSALTSNGYGSTTGAGTIPQDLAEADVSFEAGHLTIYAEGIYNSWDLNDRYGQKFTATGYSVEAAYTIFPRVSLAGRAGGLFFNSITANITGPLSVPVYFDDRWDMNTARYEGAILIRVTRESLMKIVYQTTVIAGADPGETDRLGALQFVVRF